jgi:hypothetical protein
MTKYKEEMAVRSPKSVREFINERLGQTREEDAKKAAADLEETKRVEAEKAVEEAVVSPI